MDIIIIILVVLIIILCFLNSQKMEHFVTTEEAIKDVASLYNSDVMTVGALNVTGAFNLLPRGVIVAWSGSTAPASWGLCDGTTPGAPNLSGLFILGQSSNYPLGSTGGTSSIILTVDQLPQHSHNIFASYGSQISGSIPLVNVSQQAPSNYAPPTATTGFSAPINITNPYYALAYIMKL